MENKLFDWLMESFQQPLSPLFFILGVFLLLLGLTDGLNIPGLNQVIPDNNLQGISVFLGTAFCVASVWLYYQPPSIERTAYAVLSYVLDKEQNFALLRDPFYKKTQPAGKRLKRNEQPHIAALYVASDELGLSKEILERFPHFIESKGPQEDTQIVPQPYQVQLEKNKHRGQVEFHYDFVYIFIVNEVKPRLHVCKSPEKKIDPSWYSLAEVKSLGTKYDWGIFDDMLPTMERIVHDIHEQKHKGQWKFWDHIPS